MESDLCRRIQGLRQGVAGYNPFIVIIVTAWENSNGTVKRVIASEQTVSVWPVRAPVGVPFFMSFRCIR